MTAQPAPSRIDTYDFAFRTTPDSHLYWQSTLCSIFTDRLIPCLGFKILVKRWTIPMPFFARVVLGVGSLETIIDSKCSILFIPTSKGVATQINGDFKKVYLREEGRVRKIPEKIRRWRIGALLLAKLSNPRDTRIGLSHVSPPCSL